MNMQRKRRNPWPITIIVFFIVFCSGLVSFIVFATHEHVDLVRSDYYEEEIRFQQQMDRVGRTQKLTNPAAVAYDAEHQCLTISLAAAQAADLSGQIQLYRPSDARLDRQMPLHLTRDGSQQLSTKELRGGLWKVRVQWAVNGEEYYVDQAVVIRPAA
jgi:nitrogen fixation protein FixH